MIQTLTNTPAKCTAALNVQAATTAATTKTTLFLGYILLLLLLCSTNSTQAQTCAQQRQADSLQLVALYNATGGTNWANNSGWLTGPLSTWVGITLTSDGCSVQVINLTSNGLVGNIIDLNLPNLQWVYLPLNQLSGTIPNFSGLSNLTRLDLSSNQLSGTIPNFSGLSNLLVLNLSRNQLNGTIPNFSGLSNLSVLNLYWNQLSGTIPNFNGLSSLSDINLWRNQLSGTIPNFSGLFMLLMLDLSDNQLTFAGLPQHIGQYTIFAYSPQATIPTALTNNTLSVSAGGYTQTGSTCNQFTYNWYIQGNPTPVYTTTCDSTYTPTQSGTYYCQITNSVATDLTLSSQPRTIVCTIPTAPIISGASTYCAGSAAVSLSTTIPYTSYSWSSGANTSNISV